MTLAESIAAAVLAHPSVVRLDGGPHGLVASYQVGDRVVGVRAAPGGPVELSVVLRFGRPVPEVVAELRSAVRAHAGAVPVDVGVSDLQDDGDLRDDDDLRDGTGGMP